jgi:two-component system, OmpR family, response regulator
MKVLYVDDEPFIREIAVMALELDPGFEVHQAESGVAALEVVQAGAVRPDLFLLDVMMPVLDGPATLAQLRATPGFADTPVIFMTAKAQANDLQALRALGALGVITKPFNPTTLAAEIRQVMGAGDGSGAA